MTSYVYCITCLINDKKYVGKANDPVGRWRDHLKVARNLDNEGFVVHQAIRKHGESNFKFEVVSEHVSEDEAFEAERRLICEWETMIHGYNLNEGGRGGYRPSSETRAKLSAAHKSRSKSESTCQKMSAWQVGKKLSPTTREKIGLAGRGRKLTETQVEALKKAHVGAKRSEETLARMREGQRRRRARERVE